MYFYFRNKQVREQLQADLDVELYEPGSDEMMAKWAKLIQQEMADGGLRLYLQNVLNEYWTKTEFETINKDNLVTRMEPQHVLTSRNQL